MGILRVMSSKRMSRRKVFQSFLLLQKMIWKFVASHRLVGLSAYLDAWFWRHELANLLGVDSDRIKALVGAFGRGTCA